MPADSFPIYTLYRFCDMLASSNNPGLINERCPLSGYDYVKDIEQLLQGLLILSQTLSRNRNGLSISVQFFPANR